MKMQIINNHVKPSMIRNHLEDIARDILEELDIQQVIGIQRGGYWPAKILGELLCCPVGYIYWQTREGSEYKDINPVLQNECNHASILFVDDINDSGKTFEEITQHYHCTTACIYQRHNSNFACDFVGETIHDDRWIAFPWEKYYDR